VLNGACCACVVPWGALLVILAAGADGTCSVFTTGGADA